MKLANIVKLAAAALVIYFFLPKGTSSDYLPGTWACTNEGHPYIMKMTDDGRVKFINGDQFVFGNYWIDGDNFLVRYQNGFVARGEITERSKRQVAIEFEGEGLYRYQKTAAMDLSDKAFADAGIKVIETSLNPDRFIGEWKNYDKEGNLVEVLEFMDNGKVRCQYQGKKYFATYWLDDDKLIMQWVHSGSISQFPIQQKGNSKFLLTNSKKGELLYQKTGRVNFTNEEFGQAVIAARQRKTSNNSAMKAATDLMRMNAIHQMHQSSINMQNAAINSAARLSQQMANDIAGRDYYYDYNY